MIHIKCIDCYSKYANLASSHFKINTKHALIQQKTEQIINTVKQTTAGCVMKDILQSSNISRTTKRKDWFHCKSIQKRYFTLGLYVDLRSHKVGLLYNIYTCQCLPFNELLLSNCLHQPIKTFAHVTNVV